MVNAQGNTNEDNSIIDSVKTLLNDVMVDLDKGNSERALLHLSLANQQLTSISKNATISTEVISTLLNDAIQDLENKDTNTAKAHIELINQQLNNTSTMLSNVFNNTMSPILPNKTEQQITDEVLPRIAKDSFLTYENSTYGIKLQHPSNWQRNMSFRPVFDVLFLPPGGVKPLPEVGLGIKIVNIPSNIMMLNQDIDSIYSTIEKTAPLFLKSIIPDFILTGSETTNISGMPAYSMRFIGHIGEGVKAVQTTLLIHDDKLYIVTYFAPPPAFASYLLDANRMTDSFEIVNAIGASAAGSGLAIIVMPLGSSEATSGTGYQPPEVTVSPGAAVIWDNKDNALHTATSGKSPNPDGKFDTGYVAANQQSKPITMPTEPGEYPYFCTLHPFLTGMIIVQ